MGQAFVFTRASCDSQPLPSGIEVQPHNSSFLRLWPLCVTVGERGLHLRKKKYIFGSSFYPPTPEWVWVKWDLFTLAFGALAKLGLHLFFNVSFSSCSSHAMHICIDTSM